MTLIERLKEFDRDIKNYDAPIDFVQHINLESLLSLLPEIILTLERQEEEIARLKSTGETWLQATADLNVTVAKLERKKQLLAQADKTILLCMEVAQELEKEIARKDKLLAEARILLEHVWVNGRNSICDYRDHEPADCPSEACLAREWLAAFSKETNEEQV